MNLNNDMKRYAKDGLKQEPEHDTKFKVGDRVRWTNDAGIVFENTIIGFAYSGYFRNEYKKYIHIDTDCYWYPKSDSELTLIK